MKHSLCAQTSSFSDILDIFFSLHTHTHHKYFPSVALRELQNTPGFCPHRRLIPHSSPSSLLNWVGSMTHSSDVYSVPVRSSAPLHLYMFIRERLCMFLCTRVPCVLTASLFRVSITARTGPPRPASGMKCQPVWQEQVDIMLVEQMWQPRPAGEKGAEREAEKY